MLKLIANMLHTDGISFDYDFLHQKLVPLMQRLDDSADSMRILSAKVSQNFEIFFQIFSALPDFLKTWSEKMPLTMFIYTAAISSMPWDRFSCTWTTTTNNSAAACSKQSKSSKISIRIAWQKLHRRKFQK